MNPTAMHLAPHRGTPPPLDAAGFTAAAAAGGAGAGQPLRHEIRLDGCATPFVVQRDGEGRLLTITAGNRLYVDARQPGELHFDGGFVVQRLVELPGGLLRQVEWRPDGRPVQRWSERYGWDAQGRLAEVDGVAISHDDAGRVIACADTESGVTWRYGYGGDRLCVIDTPHGLRQVSHGHDGRPLAWREGARATTALHYDEEGARLPGRATPMHWERDATGRLLAVRDEEGRVRRCYLWDGWLCLAAIDGEPGAPLAEVYSLDPGGTPVRIAGRSAVRRIARDAFGEGLQRASDPAAPHPGLYGGAIADDGYVHLPWRRLDPRLGSFDRPDPLHGEAGDPRRAGGWQGPLQIELPAAGPYTVCRHNPVSLSDPTGAISDLWWLIPSALTWSMQNTVGSLLGMWLNLQFSPLGWIVSKAAGADPFDAEWISAQNHDVFGLRADGWMSRIQPVAWTYQFLVNEEKASFTALEDARLFAPDGAFRPTLYASLLRCVPANAPPFMLRGSRGRPNATPLADWSRCGGTAEAAFPGSLAPVFPAGGLHFDTVQRGARAQGSDIVEVVPAATMTTGVAGSFASLTVPGTSLGFVANADLLLEDSAGVLDIVRVLDADDTPPSTLVRADPSPARLAAGALRLRGLTAPAGTEALQPVAGEPRLLQVAGSSLDYAPALSVLRLARAGAVLHVARVDGLQARLALETPVPPEVGSDFTVRLASASGSFTGRLGPTANTYEVQSGTAPSVGGGILVGTGAAALPAVVRSAAGAVLTLDRNLSALGAPGTAQPWQALAPGAALGQHAGAPEVAAVLTYVPAAIGTAPAAGYAWLQGAQAAVRRITGLNHDALVMSAPRPDALADAYDCTRWRVAAADIAGVTAGTVQTIALDTALPADATALHLLPFGGATVAAGADLFTPAAALTLAAGTPPVVTTTIDASLLAGTLRCGDVVVLTPAAGPAVAAVVRRLRLTVTVAPALTVGAGPVEAARLVGERVSYAAELPDPRVPQRQVQLRVPVAGGVRQDMPRFVAGELVRVNYSDATGAARRGHYRIGAVTGLTLTLEGDVPVPANSTNLLVDRLRAGDAQTGSARWGIEGAAVGPGQLVFSVWDTNAGLGEPTLAFIEGATVQVARVTAAAQPLTVELAIAGDPASLAGGVRLSEPTGPAAGIVTASFIADQLTLNVPGATMIPTGQRAAVVPYVDTARRSTGRLHAGSVRMPDDHENQGTQLTRRQALEDHELSHTMQSARLGPLMLVAFPLWALELANDLTAAGGPAFSPYLAGTLADGVVTPSAAAGFEDGGKVQVAQNRRVVTVTLGAASGGGFRLGDADRRSLGTAGFINGAVQLRRPLGGRGNDVLEWTTNIAQLLTIGGLMNNLTLAGWGGVAALVTQAVQGIRHAARSKVTVPLADDGVTLTLAADQSLDGLQQGVQVAVKKGDAIQLRAVGQFVGRTVVLAAPVAMRGEVELSVYAPGAALFGLRSFFPATVPDADRPARLQIEAVGGNTLTLAVHDRVEVRTSTGSAHRTLVTRVDGTAVELEEGVLLRADTVGEFLIGKVGEEDPSGWLDSWLLDRLQIGWMQYLHDPWGQILYRAQPAAGDVAAQIFARSARYLFGTQSWMFCGLGFFWNDNAYKRDNPHRSLMEQEASRRSGDTYCPLGTLHGNVMVVGDVARYWVTVNGGSRDGSGDTPTDLITFGNQDAAGVHLVQAPTITAPVGSAFVLPEALYTLSAAGVLTGIGARGFVPTDAVLERSAGMHVVFSRPAPTGSYTITAQSLTGLDNSTDAQAKGVATISFDRTPQDVTVRTAGVVIAEAPATPVTLVPFQRMRFAVEPNGSRVYRITVGAEGRRFDTSGLALTARGLLGTDDAEISRFHHFDGTRYDSGIGPFHLPADLHVAVRRFAVEVVDTLPLRATLDHTAAALPRLAPGGSGFVLVPAPLAAAPVQVQVAGALPVNGQASAAAGTPAAATRDFLGDGGALQISLPADEPPEDTVRVTVRVQVGPASGTPVPLRCEFDLVPAFTLASATGFAVARGATVTLTSSDGRPIVAVAPPAGVTVAPNGADLVVTIDAGRAVGPLTLRAADAADATRQARRILQVT